MSERHIAITGVYAAFCSAADLPFSALRFPVGLRVHDRDPWSVRVIQAIDEENGSLRLDRDIPQGARARFMVGSAEHLIEAAAMAVRQSRQELGAPAQLSVVLSCYGRRVVLICFCCGRLNFLVT